MPPQPSLLCSLFRVPESKPGPDGNSPPVRPDAATSGFSGRLLFGARGAAALAPALAAATGAALAAGEAGGRGRSRQDRRLGVDLEDPEPQDPIGDLQVVVELAEEVAGCAEAEPAVVGLGPLADLVGQLANAPGVLVLELAATLDLGTGVFGELVSRRLLEARIEHQDQLVFEIGRASCRE